MFTKVPLVTPHRLDIIVNEVQEYVASTMESKEIFIDVKEVQLNGTENRFHPTTEIIAQCIHLLPRSYEDSDFKGREIFLPNATICCGRKLKIDHRHSIVIIYSEEGMKECFNFHGNCQVCKSKHYHSFIEDNANFQYYSDVGKIDHFIISSSTGFTTKFLKRVTYQISIGATSFEKISDMYNIEHNLYDSKALSPGTIENTWLILYKIVQMIQRIPWYIRLSPNFAS